MRFVSHRFLNVGAALTIASTLLVAAHAPSLAKAPQAKITTLRLGYLENNPQWAPTLDPGVVTDTNSSWLIQLMNAGLVNYKMSKGKLVVYPQLASKWSVSKDGKTYTFFIRKNAKFADGHPVTAADVVFSIRRALDPKTASPVTSYDSLIVGYKAFTTGKSKSLGVKAVNSSTVQIKISQKASYFLPTFTYPINMVLEKRVLQGKKTDTGGSYLTTTCKANVGAGQFMPVCQNGSSSVTSFYPAGSTPTLTLVANKHYYGRHPNLKLVIPAIDSNQTGYSDFKAGNLDYTFGVPANLQASLKGKAGVHQFGSSGIEYLAPNLDQPPFNNLHCRLAVAESIDRATLVNQVLHGAYKTLYTVVPPGFLSYYNASKSTPHYDPADVKKQLAQCPGGINITYTYRNDTTDRRAAADALQAMMAQQGIKFTLHGIPRSDWLKVILNPLKNNNVPLAYDDWFMDFPDPQDYLDILLRSGQPQNCEGWNNAQYDKLIDKGNTAPTPALRAKYYIQAQKLVLSQAAFIPVDNFTNFDMLNPKVKGMEPNYYNGVEWAVNNDWANVTKG